MLRLKVITCFPSQLLADTLLIMALVVPASAQLPPIEYIGCGGPPYTACNDPLSATNLSGSWIDSTGDSEWTLTADYAVLGQSGTVTGFVYVFPPPDAYTCPVFQYEASGYFIPTNQPSNLYGSTDFRWDARNPSPYLTCSGYTPVTLNIYEGHRSSSSGISNKGNDYGTGIFTNDSGLSGPIQIYTNLMLDPTGESLSVFTGFDAAGWGDPEKNLDTEVYFMQTLEDTKAYDPPDPHANRFQARQVFESANGLATDGC